VVDQRRGLALRPKLMFVLALFRTSLKAAMALRFAFALQVLFMALNNWTFFTFWWLLLRRVPDIHGFVLRDLALVNGVVAAGYGLAVTLAGGVTRLARLIDEGELDVLLTLPQPTLPYALLSQCRASGIGDLVSGLILLIVVGRVGWAEAPWVALAVPLSALSFVASGTLIFSAAFWLGSSEAMAFRAWELLVTFSLYPEPLFGPRLRVLLFTLLPAGFTAFLPVALLRHPSPWTLASAAGGTLAYVSLAIWMFRRGLRRYASGSRFGVWG
jgi:ABC-2 type transport system permease protein